MALYRLADHKLEHLPRTSFQLEGIRERADLQRIIRDQPEVIEDGLFIVSEEFSNWEDSYLRIDLLGVSRDARLVVVELKRDERGGVMELQALRYAAMVSNMTLDQIIDAHQAYLWKRGINEDSRTRIYGHLGFSELDNPEIYTQRPRIILAAGDFSKELTTSVLWLNQSGIDISCIRIQPYRMGEEMLVETNQIIPLPEAEHYLVQIREKGNESERQHAKSGVLVPGGESFQQSIASASAHLQASLEGLYKWAAKLEQQGLLTLSTYHGRSGVVTLLMRLPGETGGLATVYNSPGGAYLKLWRSVFERRAPGTITPVEKLITPNLIGQGTTVRNISDELLRCLGEAYREAASRPSNPLTATPLPPDAMEP